MAKFIMLEELDGTPALVNIDQLVRVGRIIGPSGNTENAELYFNYVWQRFTVKQTIGQVAEKIAMANLKTVGTSIGVTIMGEILGDMIKEAHADKVKQQAPPDNQDPPHGGK